ncbi:hypothetical protein LVJ94_08190 [Pendulispora rubella]|uniref:Secreted protein n=1 Tax=Pendulispora rubella TaxID=2741070 RepID=A0ABZ2LBB6_9BACT
MRRQMWVRVASVFATLVAGSFAIMTGCLPDQERTSYGPAEGGKRQFPAPEPGNGAPAGDGGTPDPGQICGSSGPIDAGPCRVSWKTQIFPSLAATGSLGCGKTSCHNAGGTSPTISAENATDAWNQLVAHSFSKDPKKDKKYINPCSVDPDDSAILCDLDGQKTCGKGMPPGSGGSPDDVKNITDWVKCGSPNN